MTLIPPSLQDALESRLKVWHLIVGLALTMGGGLVTAASAWTNVTRDIRDIRDNGSTPFQGMRDDVTTIKGDIKWIKEAMQR